MPTMFLRKLNSLCRLTMTLPLIALLVLSGCTTAPVTKTDAKAEAKIKGSSAAEEPLEIIDAHTHNHFTGKPERTSSIPDTREQYLKEFREANVVGAVAHMGADDEPDTSLHAYGVVHCAGVGVHPNVKKIEAGLKSGKYGCIKIYLGYVHQWAYDKNYEPAYKLAEKYDVPVVFHTGDTYSTKGKLKYSDPLTIDEVAVDHPKVQLVIAHCGNPWFQSAAEVAYKNPNVALECSALLIDDMNAKGEAAVNRLMVEPIRWIFDYLEDPSKMMFGTDWPLVHIKDYAEAYKRAIPREHWKAVFHDNAVRIFKIPKRTKLP